MKAILTTQHGEDIATIYNFAGEPVIKFRFDRIDDYFHFGRSRVVSAKGMEIIDKRGEK